MGGFLGIGNSSAKTDRKETLAGYGQLTNLFNFGMGQAQQGAAAGQAAQGQAQDYWSKILSGNRPSVLQAVAPETNAVNAAGDAQRRERATMGTARGGGTAGANQAADTARAAAIDNYIFGARGEAAKQEADLGSKEMNEAIAELGIAGNSAANLTAISADSRKTSIAANNQIQAQIGGLIEGALGAFAV